MRIYLAGPLFTSAEKQWNKALADELETHGFQVWLPQEHYNPEADDLATFATNVSGINKSDVVVANLDQPDPDSGTCWELGYCWNKKPTYYYRTDIRTCSDGNSSKINLMLTMSGVEITPVDYSIEELALGIWEMLLFDGKRYEDVEVVEG